MGRFISRLCKRALPFFKLMKKKCLFEWTSEADAAFEDLKRYLMSLPVMAGCWTEEFKVYLLRGTLPEKEEDIERIVREATAYCGQDGELYLRRPNDVSQRCISEEQGRELLADIHVGGCRRHSSSCTLVGKVFRSGFYWPTALNDATELVRSCEACQFHAKQIHQPAQGV
ncbi:uncharacterized protein [Aegilops tauschii subsp. strangulata]|uniref:uncharacterized protein n=1 Tax=Aegilops tauschii subsp. strangulata TaxID=200361 RepID=UPI003CC8DC89